MASLKTARANLSCGIREAKRQYSRGIAHRFSDSRDTWSLWWGFQTITDYKPPPQTCDSTISLLNKLNTFARFEKKAKKTAPLHRRPHLLLVTSVRRSLSRINAEKAPGPDNIPGHVLREGAVELTEVFTDIFNISLNQAFKVVSKPPPSFRSQKSHLPPALMTTIQLHLLPSS
ncbi:Cytochrome c oxidase subunit 5A, mitochondrial [Labeo rohita]|uniref:Cytochrome c oxidase subunit 5A, mitochondrial n=1 Tax=Labeo rohita TaxID=84645 RepID=A0ABQ8LZD3_LABRO|nr:Cytochrome c oxidase subunit 5A, mitochondrial [Labeo rohita]